MHLAKQRTLKGCNKSCRAVSLGTAATESPKKHDLLSPFRLAFTFSPNPGCAARPRAVDFRRAAADKRWCRLRHKIATPFNVSVYDQRPKFEETLLIHPAPAAQLHSLTTAPAIFQLNFAPTPAPAAQLHSHTTACICPTQFRPDNGPSGAQLHSLGSRSAPQVCTASNNAP